MLKWHGFCGRWPAAGGRLRDIQVFAESANDSCAARSNTRGDHMICLDGSQAAWIAILIFSLGFPRLPPHVGGNVGRIQVAK
jgi:hypothetical protein